MVHRGCAKPRSVPVSKRRCTGHMAGRNCPGCRCGGSHRPARRPGPNVCGPSQPPGGKSDAVAAHQPNSPCVDCFEHGQRAVSRERPPERRDSTLGARLPQARSAKSVTPSGGRKRHQPSVRYKLSHACTACRRSHGAVHGRTSAEARVGASRRRSLAADRIVEQRSTPDAMQIPSHFIEESISAFGHGGPELPPGK